MRCPSSLRSQYALRALTVVILLVSGASGCGSSEREAPSADAPEVAEAELRLSEGRHYRVGLKPRHEPVPVGPAHEWVLRVVRGDGGTFSPKRISIEGGLPAVGDGLERAPRITPSLRPGEFIVEGVRFHAPGDWVLRVELDGERGEDVAHFRVHVGP